MYTLGVDIGTFESKGVLVDQAGRIIAQATRPHQMIVPQPGWAEHRADQDWWGDFVQVTKALLTQSQISPADITCVATSAIGPCMLAVDGDGTPVMNGVLYGVDTRASAEIDLLNAALTPAAILAKCGNALTSQSVGPKVLWLQRQRPDLWARTARIGTATTYLTYRLTGAWVMDHYTAASYTPLYDIAAQGWDTDFAQICPAAMLPRLMWSTEIAGQITAQAAAETGLAAGTPVTCGTIDAAAEAVSVGTLTPGDMMMMYGSTIFIILLTDRLLQDRALWHAPWLFPGQHAAMAGLATSGTLTHWFRDTFARELPHDTAFATLAAEAQSTPPGANGLLCLPYFSGERTPLHDPLAKGAFFGLNLTHGRGHIYRAVIEGIAAATRHITDTYAAAGYPPTRVLAVGGGTRNRLWLQATSDMTGLDQTISRISMGASYGNAFLAALATGTVRQGDIHRWNPPQDSIAAMTQPGYAPLYQQFRALYTDTRDIAHKL